MTDVPFIALSTIALLVYTRALRQANVGLMLVGSVCAAAAVLVRQFGLAFVPALALVWLAESSRWRRLPLMLSGALLPCAAAVWQFQQGVQHTAWTARFRSAEQMAFLGSSTFGLDLMWRLLVIPGYLALYAIPLLLIAAAYSVLRRQTSREGRPLRDILTYAAICFVGLAAGSIWLRRPEQPLEPRPVVLPWLDWNFEFFSSWPRPVVVLLTGVVIVLGGWLCSAVVRRYRDRQYRPADRGEWLLDAFVLFLLLEQLVYVQFSDRYLLVFLPFALIVAGRELWLQHEPRRPELRAALALTLAMLITSAAWQRSTLSRGEALWKGGQWLLARGTPAEQVHSDSWEWEYYSGSFDRWLLQQPDPSDYARYFDEFLPAEWQRARYVVVARPLGAPANSPPALLTSFTYRDGWLRQRFVDVIDRRPDGPPR
jgi:hypothetical protein